MHEYACVQVLFIFVTRRCAVYMLGGIRFIECSNGGVWKEARVRNKNWKQSSAYRLKQKCVCVLLQCPVVVILTQKLQHT